MNTRLFTITRSFQGGATFVTFDKAKFEKGVVAPIKKLLATAPPEFIGIAVVTCAEAGSRYAEEVMDGDTPTMVALKSAFPNEITQGKIVPVVCENWGLNAGSGTAINEGISIARQRGADKVLVWSPEIDLNGHMVSEMLNHMEDHALKLVGYMRNRWYQRLQWAFAQNTCAIWDLDLLKAIDDMNPACNGDGKTTVSTPEFGEVALAGMEDIEAYFRASKFIGEFVRWGAVGMRHPAVWNLALKVPGTKEYDDNAKKLARQGLVMDEYAKRIFPHLEPIEVYDQMMQVASFA
jgi:hypothetical protein